MKESGHRAWQVVKGKRPGLLPRERRILRLRDQGRTLAAIGELYGITGERVRQIEHQARKKLRKES